jgi:hybrid cluster-associated redox disulfide protein
MNALNPTLTVAELLDQWPAAIPVFLKHRMYCVGCSMASFESLEDALKIYRIPCAPFLDELNQAVQQAAQTKSL